MTFSDKIKRAREVAKMTQHELAQEVGVSQRTIASYESGGARARKSTTEKLAHALKVSVRRACLWIRSVFSASPLRKSRNSSAWSALFT